LLNLPSFFSTFIANTDATIAINFVAVAVDAAAVTGDDAAITADNDAAVTVVVGAAVTASGTAAVFEVNVDGQCYWLISTDVDTTMPRAKWSVRRIPLGDESVAWINVVPVKNGSWKLVPEKENPASVINR